MSKKEIAKLKEELEIEKNKTRLYVDIRWESTKENEPLKARGMCNNRTWSFYTSGFRNVYWFEGSTCWMKIIDMINHGDPEYYCLTNEAEPFDQSLTKKMCSEIIKECCRKFAFHLVKVQAQ